MEEGTRVGTTPTNEPRRPIRRILVRFEATRGYGALQRAAEIARRERATIDICGTVRRRSVLLSLALVGGVPVTPDSLEAEELKELAEEMRMAVADLPADLGIRSFLLVGNPRRKLAELLAAGNYDLVV
ncbi:MAG: universal stress protein [Verrucomicrobia bacterium]|nr:universal stress protein [Verrucomicrobiota bacterium]